MKNKVLFCDYYVVSGSVLHRYKRPTIQFRFTKVNSGTPLQHLGFVLLTTLSPLIHAGGDPLLRIISYESHWEASSYRHASHSTQCNNGLEYIAKFLRESAGENLKCVCFDSSCFWPHKPFQLSMILVIVIHWKLIVKGATPAVQIPSPSFAKQKEIINRQWNQAVKKIHEIN